MAFRGSRRLGGALGAVTVLLAGCSVGPDYATPPAPVTAQVTNEPLPAHTAAADTVGGTAQTFRPGADIPGAWWELFRSPQITRLVMQALRGNPDLKAAQATLREARESVTAEQGAFFPSISATALAERQQISLAAFGFPSGGTARFNLYSGALNVNYAFDVWGVIRRQVEQLRAQAEYDQDELEAAYLTLTGNLVGAVLTEAEIKEQIAATEQIIALYRQELTVVQERFAAGAISRAEVLQQQSSLAAAVATLPPLRKQLAQQRDLVASYLGVVPNAYTSPTIDLGSLHLPGELPSSLPSQIVAQRPDIRAYAALLHAATANVGVAIANMLPQLTLSASYGREAIATSQLLTPSGIVWSLAGGLTQPLFEGGTLLHRKRAAVAAMQAAAAQYGSTVNTAFRNVADALVAVAQDAETLRAQLTSERAAADSLAVTRSQFEAGATTYLNVLQAEQTYRSARLQLVGAQAARFIDTVALFQALGGGWWHRPDVAPDVAKCCGILPWTQ